jgi:CRP/FNR family transcriptional regulator, cyclic AMP receptor protein
MATKIDLTQGHPFLRAMVPEHRAILVQGAEDKALGMGDVLFREGEPANRLYLIEEGHVVLETHVPGRGDILIADLGEGQVLGWSWLVAPFVWHFQARAVTPAKVTVLNGAHLLVASEQNQYLGYELMKSISRVVLEVLLVAHRRLLESGHPLVVADAEKQAAAVLDRTLPLEARVTEHPFFQRMPIGLLNKLVELAKPIEFEPGQTVFECGEPATGLHLIERGRLILEAPWEGKFVPVQTINSGDTIGWSSFCDPYRWHSNSRALEATATLFFSAADLRERCAADYHVGYELTKRITRMMLQRLQAIRNRIWQAYSKSIS